MKTKHHYQRVNTETGYLIATREDMEKYQDLEIREYTPSGELYAEQRIVYNIQYDYIRSQDWQGGILINDAIQGLDSYGHLQAEYTEGGLTPPDDWVNPYPDNHEPVKTEGADMFHSEGIAFIVSFHKARISALANFYIWEDLDEEHRERMTNLITELEPLSQWSIEKYQEEQAERARHPVIFDPIEAAQKRLKAIRKHSKKIGVTIPYDPLFID